MQDDNVLPNDGTYLGGVPLEPQHQREERAKEKAEVLKTYELIEILVDRLKARIQYYESVHSIPDEVRTDLKAFMAMHTANTQTARNLTDELGELLTLVEEYK